MGTMQNRHNPLLTCLVWGNVAFDEQASNVVMPISDCPWIPNLLKLMRRGKKGYGIRYRSFNTWVSTRLGAWAQYKTDTTPLLAILHTYKIPLFARLVWENVAFDKQASGIVVVSVSDCAWIPNLSKLRRWGEKEYGIRHSFSMHELVLDWEP